MKLLDNLLKSIEKDAPVRQMLIGIHWVVVCSRFCGMASALTEKHSHGHFQVKNAGYLHHQTARDLAKLAQSENLLEASVGVAAINSLLDIDESQAVEVNAGEVLDEYGRGKNVALVGHFPFIPQLKKTARQLWVIEQQPTAGEYPAEATVDLVPQADVVAITGTALINGTLDGLLALCRPEAHVMVLGPSTPLSPVLFDYGVNIISGTQVIDKAAVIRTVGQGASFRQVEGVRLLTFINEQEEN